MGARGQADGAFRISRNAFETKLEFEVSDELQTSFRRKMQGIGLS